MQREFLVLVLGVSLIAGCGGDDDDNGSSGGSGGSGGTTTSSGGTTSAGGSSGLAGSSGASGAMGEGGSGASSENLDCNPSGSGVCQNEGDCPAVESGRARMESQTCGVACLQDADPGACSVACIVNAADISSACAVCYAGAVGCATEKCFNECIEDPAAEGCTQCQVDKGCRSDFSDCSGLSD